jgi:hypothetical protein
LDEQTNPQGGVEPSLEDRVKSFLDNTEEQDAPEQTETTEAQPEANAQEQPTDQATDEVTADDLPADEAPPAVTVETLEVVHNGQKRVLTRDEATQLAQQGLDYTQKTQAVAEQARQLTTWLQRTREIEEFQEQLAPERASLSAIQAQLKQWEHVNWVQLATDEPLEYPRYQAQYQQLVNAANAAERQLQGKAHVLQEAKKQVAQQIVQQEMPKLLERIPEWRDPDKYKAGVQRLTSYLASEGFAEHEIGSLVDSRMVVQAEKARKYDELVKAKAEKSKLLRSAPPVVKPNAPLSRDSARADKEREGRERLKRSGDPMDAAALLLNRMK